MPLPRVQPIIPISGKEPFDDPDWLFDFKYDGFRALLYLEQGSGRFLSRNGNTLTRFDALARAMAAELEVTEAIFDGEVIVADETGRPLFYDLLRHSGRPAYVAFDLLWLNGTDLRSLPLSERRTRLRRILPAASSGVSEALSVESRGRELFEPCDPTTSRASSRSAWPIPTSHAPDGSRSKTPTTRRKRGEGSYLIGRGKLGGRFVFVTFTPDSQF
jgi:hypothetical protein